MGLIQIYQCLCDETRLRILNLLGRGPLCVCHLQKLLGESQVNVSKHLAYLKKRGLVGSRRSANWMIYSLPAKPSREMRANLACLQDCALEQAAFRRDLSKLDALQTKFADNSPICCPPKKRLSRSPISPS